MRFILHILFLAIAMAASAQSVLSTLATERPRILVEHDRFDRLREQAATDTLLACYVGQVVGQADALLDKPLPVYNPVEGVLLDTSRDCLDRILTLSTAYRMTDRECYARRAAETLRAICRFPDWNFYHFLDVAEMGNAVAIGYDWLYDTLDDELRDEIRRAIIRNAIVPGLAVYGFSPWQYWLDVEYNWNQVCNGGLVIASLAIADTDPGYAEKIIPLAVKYFPSAMEGYAPDGAWNEGVSYWFYATRYSVYTFTTMLASLGTDFGLSSSEGFDRAGYFPIQMTTPSGAWYSFSDINRNNGSKPLPVMFWLADRFDNRHFSEYEHRMLRRYPAHALDVVYYTPRVEDLPELPLDEFFGGEGEFVAMRHDHDGGDGLFVAVSGGDNRINHGHLDKGSFELECDGIKWVRELGSDNYFLPGYWEKEPGGRRWQYLRLNSFGHAVPIINNENQRVDATSHFVKTDLNVAEPFAVIDLSELYAPAADSVKRCFALFDGRRALLVNDRYRCSAGTQTIRWQFLTEARVECRGNHLLLSQDGKEMQVMLLTPGLKFRTSPLADNPPQQPNDTYTLVYVDIPNPKGVVDLKVLFSPDGSGVKRARNFKF